MTMTPFLKLALSVITLTLVAGCASRPAPAYSVPTEEVYNSAYRDGGRDTVEVIREGLRSRQVYGVADPYIPLRTPDEVIPVWVPDYVDASGRRISGHWQHTVVRRSQWYTE